MEENSMWLFEKDNALFFSEGEIITEMLFTRKKQWTEQSSCYLKRHLELSPRCCLKSFTIFVGKFLKYSTYLGIKQVIWCKVFYLQCEQNILLENHSRSILKIYLTSYFFFTIRSPMHVGIIVDLAMTLLSWKPLKSIHRTYIFRKRWQSVHLLS